MWSKTFPGLGGRFSPPQAGKHFAFQVDWIVTLRERSCKSFLREGGQQIPRYKQREGLIIKAVLLADFMHCLSIERMRAFERVEICILFL